MISSPNRFRGTLWETLADMSKSIAKPLESECLLRFVYEPHEGEEGP